MKHHKHTLKPLPNAVLSLEADQDHVIATVEDLLERDQMYQSNMRTLDQQVTTGQVSVRIRRCVRAWQIGDAIRRAGLPIAHTRTYLKLCV